MEQVSVLSFTFRYFLLGSALTCQLDRPLVRHLTSATRHYTERRRKFSLDGVKALTKREEQNTHTDKNTATSKITPKMMKSCSSLAKESSHMIIWQSMDELQQIIISTLNYV